jgi:hypothetical protein
VKQLRKQDNKKYEDESDFLLYDFLNTLDSGVPEPHNFSAAPAPTLRQSMINF